ncbi:unnamed protein product [Parnassius apollo]|uniref:(apollo) hypothetical protein n=1 Tax=Parnassius apollo TaxID=110799 RepID=A0A8S3XFK6_PARAO|nr:unnamed protein product [Parnassius apollo]
MMWWAVWCIAVAAMGAFAAAGPAGSALAPFSAIDWEQIDPAQPALEDESFNGVPSMGGRYTAAAPWLYLFADVPRETQVKGNEAKRSRSAFSVYPAVEVLQQGAYNNYLERLAHANRDFLNCVGKRDPWNSPDCMLKN